MASHVTDPRSHFVKVIASGSEFKKARKLNIAAVDNWPREVCSNNSVYIYSSSEHGQLVLHEHSFCGTMKQIEIVIRDPNEMTIADDSGHTRTMTGTPSSGIRNMRHPGGGWRPMRCFRCDRPGHFSRNCTHLKRGGAAHSQR